MDSVDLTPEGWLVIQHGYQLARLPAEAYLHELADADPRSTADIRQIAALGTWCPLGSSALPHAAYEDLPIRNAPAWRRALAETAALNGRTMGLDDLEQRREAAGQRLGWPVHLEEVAIRLRHVQALTEHLVAFQDGTPVRDAWRKCTSDAAAWDRFALWANAALREFHVRVAVSPEAAISTVYAVSVLQLVNDLSDGETFRRCANETCGRPFIRQRGRARYPDKGTRHATGVLYCSRSCARAQAERMRRRSKRSERNGS